MRIWRHLIWKEWLELRWKLAALTAIPTGCVALVAAYEPADVASSPMSSLGIALFGYVAIAPIFLTMHTAARERAEGTLEFIRGLPCSPRQVGRVRVVASAVAIAIPILVATALWYGLWSTISKAGLVQPLRPRLTSGSDVLFELSGAVATFTTTAISLYLWGTAMAMNQPTELRAGAIALAVAGGWAGWTMFSASQWDNPPYVWYWMYAITAIGPFAGGVLLDPGLSVAGRIGMGSCQLATWLALIGVAVRRYGALEPETWKLVWAGERRFSSPIRALLWMQSRQAIPLALGAGATLIALAGTQGCDLMILAGGAWAIVIATTLFSADLEPQLAAFWQSRPIDVAHWFWTKILVGALVILVCLDLPAAVVLQPRGQSGWAEMVAFATCVPVLHLAVYGFAVLVTCLVRNTIYAGILSMGAMLALVMLPMIASPGGALTLVNVLKVMERFVVAATLGEPGAMLAAVTFYVLFAGMLATLTTLAALWVVRHDVAVRS